MRTLNSNRPRYASYATLGAWRAAALRLAGAASVLALLLSSPAQAQAYVNVTVGGAFSPNV